MSNIQRLAVEENKNHRLFGATIASLKNSQGFYSRLFEAVNGLSEDAYAELYEQLEQQDFQDAVDVVLWLES